MSEGEHTLITRIPRERLNQIASRKLAALGLPVRLGADRETLEGELAFTGKVVHPATGQPVARARFTVVGHAQLRFADPPLSALGVVGFAEHERVAALEGAVAAALARRAGHLQELAARLRALGLEATLDPDRLALRAVVKAQTHAFELLASATGVRVSRVAPVGGAPFDASPTFPPLDLAAFAAAADLERHLVRELPRLEPPPRVEPVKAAPPAPLEATPPPRTALTLAALQRSFGPDATLAPSAPVELVEEFQHAGTRYRFVAAREAGTLFRGRLIGPSGDVWSDRFELSSFPGTRQVVALALGAAEPAPAAAGAGAGGLLDAAHAGAARGDVPQHLQPQPGEIWVMSVVIERSGPDEVRYVGTDIDGRPYGAARVLARADFEAVFTEVRGGWRLLVRIDQVQDGNVVYRQLDAARQPIGAPRRMPGAILVANFVPEAAAY
jgi:hypothetical protein